MTSAKRLDLRFRSGSFRLYEFLPLGMYIHVGGDRRRRDLRVDERTKFFAKLRCQQPPSGSKSRRSGRPRNSCRTRLDPAYRPCAAGTNPLRSGTWSGTTATTASLPPASWWDLHPYLFAIHAPVLRWQAQKPGIHSDDHLTRHYRMADEPARPVLTLKRHSSYSNAAVHNRRSRRRIGRSRISVAFELNRCAWPAVRRMSMDTPAGASPSSWLEDNAKRVSATDALLEMREEGC